jgi:serine/threonine protein kinase
MAICINCNAQNSNNNLFCQQCGSDLLLEGRYRASHQLGSGGFGATYEVNDQGTSKVLKVLRNNSDTAIRLFQREAKFLASNNHLGIPKAEYNGYFEFQPKNSQQPIHCLVMEKIEGVNLKEYIKQSGKPIKGDLGLRWLKEMVEILDRVHSQDIIHRDIKPQNIMLQPDGKLVLIDFGAVTNEGIVGEGTETATATSGTQTATHTAGGTSIFSKGYAAPEQIQGKAIKESDIYSLGQTFIYLLTAKEPNNPIMYDGYHNQINWQQYAQEVSPQFADLIDSMIKSVASQRPANTQVILQQLQQVGGVAKKGEDIEVQIEISEVEGATGTSKEITVTRVININGKLQPETEQLTVRIPAGAKEGQKMRLLGQGNKGEYGGENGDIYVKLSVYETAQVIGYIDQNLDELEERSGCLGFVGNIFGNKQKTQPKKLNKPISKPSQLENWLTKPLEGSPTLNITVFGPRGVGKTSILAAMYDQFNRTTKNTDIQLTGNLKTSAILQERVIELQSPFALSEDVEATGGIQGTSEPQDFMFELSRVSRPAIMKLCFKDFPGGRIGVNALETEMLEVKQLLKNCKVVLIVIDSPALMEDNGIWHQSINKPSLIRDYFKLSYQKITEPNLILFVPSKCEKYMKINPDQLLQKVKEGYSDLLDFFSNEHHRHHLIVGVTPVQTLGNIVFDRIETNIINNQKQPHFYYKKVGQQYKPYDSEQPLRFILKFILKLHLKNQILLSKTIRLVLGSLFEDVAFKDAVNEFGKSSKTGGGFAILQDEEGWLN